MWKKDFPTLLRAFAALPGADPADRRRGPQEDGTAAAGPRAGRGRALSGPRRRHARAHERRRCAGAFLGGRRPAHGAAGSRRQRASGGGHRCGRRARNRPRRRDRIRGSAGRSRRPGRRHVQAGRAAARRARGDVPRRARARRALRSWPRSSRNGSASTANCWSASRDGCDQPLTCSISRCGSPPRTPAPRSSISDAARAAWCARACDAGLEHPRRGRLLRRLRRSRRGPGRRACWARPSSRSAGGRLPFPGRLLRPGGEQPGDGARRGSGCRAGAKSTAC